MTTNELTHSTIMLWKDDFVRAKDWNAVCEILKAPADTVEMEVHILNVLSYSTVHRNSKTEGEMNMTAFENAKSSYEALCSKASAANTAYYDNRQSDYGRSGI